MYHRYGRHGPHAWLRWYRHRFRSRALALSQAAVIRVVHAERIIIIMVGVPGREGVGNPNDYLLDGDPFYLITYYAEHEAEKRAEADLIIDDPLSDAEIQDYAKEAWERYVSRDDITRIGAQTRIRASELRQKFIEALSQEYDQLIERAGQSVPDEAVKAIRRVAREDKRNYRALLPGTSIPYLGVVRAQQQLPPGPAVDLEYIHQIAGYVSIYEEAYHKYDPIREKERL